MARSVVDEPDEVRVEQEEDEGYIIYQLHVAEDDVGKVIGRRGRVAKAMRTLLKVAAIKNNERSILEIE
ncbi:MAG TPA: KH domain-containing protein [Chloroflexota bacterium]|nr:KH domain-containing protein [Chloroflexota bacterium]